MDEFRQEKKLLEQEYNKVSEFVIKLLNQSQSEFLEEIEQRYQEMQLGLKRRRELYGRLGDHSIVIFGCGKRGHGILESFCLNEERVLCLTDNQTSLWGKEVNGKQILSPQEAVSKYPTAYFVVASKFYADEIKEQLLGLGVQGEHILIYR